MRNVWKMFDSNLEMAIFHSKIYWIFTNLMQIIWINWLFMCCFMWKCYVECCASNRKKSVQCLGSIVPSMYPTIFMYCDHFIARIKHNVVLFKNSHKHEQHCHKHNVLLEAPWQWQCWARPISCEYQTTPKWIPHLC